MKRSEAIRILADKINEDQYQDYGVFDYQVSEALQLLENAGMLPPKACIQRNVRVGDEERVAYHNTNEWEPEDE